MKKLLFTGLIAVIVFALSACSGSSSQKKIVVGASNVPHAEILEQAKPILAKEGIDLEIKKFQDYVLPNKALADKELDANYFQHTPYLDKENQEKGYNLVSVGKIHIEPMGIYSKKYKNLKDLPNGATIVMGNNIAEQGRMLNVLQTAGIIKLKDGVDIVKATIKDVVDNPKNLKFKTDIEPGLLTKVYENNEADATFINANYAIDAGLNPVKDAIAVESSSSPYANLIAVRKGDENRAEIKELVKVLHSKEIQDFINTKYKGAVIPVSE